ncbi:MAG: acyltransferase [Deltaproteobacteria bacterium]|nr:acyltransferase [Deltaproteobacteria bacterium]
MAVPHDDPRAADKLRYNPAIDGLRAISVLAVIAYHLGLAGAGGGYLGVEVFFVISGFLVVALMVEEERGPGFALGPFWMRRARRLLPAVAWLLVVVAIAVPWAWPDAADPLPGQVASAAGYVANWHQIAADASYFDAYSRPPLLRHLWSLAVEEQFYLLYPLLFVAVARWRGVTWVRHATAALVLALTALATTVLRDRGLDRSYLGTDARVIGILIGALLALSSSPWRWPRRTSRAWGVIAGLAGAALVAAFAGLALDADATPTALFAQLRAVDALTLLLLMAVTQPLGIARRLCGVAPLAAIGRRSYSLYLWHWPVFAVTRPELDVGAVTSVIARVVGTIALAELSYRVIEGPIRTRALQTMVRRELASGDRRGRARVILAVIIGLPLVAVASLVMVAVGPRHVSELEARLAQADAADQAGLAPAPGPSFRDVTVLGANDTARARDALARALPGAAIDVRRNRDLVAATQEAVRLAEAHQLRQVVVLEVAQNGAITVEQLTALTRALPDRTLALVTPRGTDHYSTALGYDGNTRRAVAMMQVLHPRLYLIDTIGPLGDEPEAAIDQPLAAGVPERFAALVAGATAALPLRDRDLRGPAITVGRASTPVPRGRYAGVLIIGDSVIRAASPALFAGLPGVEIDGKIGRQAAHAITILEATVDDPRAQTIVLLVGNNASITDEELDALVRAAAGRRLILCTLRLLGNRAAIANARLRRGSQRGARYTVCDWAATADPHPEWFLDGAHTNAQGDAALVAQLRACLDATR